ncbi:MAG: VOC family protein, partial [Bacteroidota bacterium]
PFTDNGTNATGALVEKEHYQAGENNTVIYFASEDCHTEANKVQDAGGQIVRPKTPIGEFGFISILADLDGNLIGLHSRK